MNVNHWLYEKTTLLHALRNGHQYTFVVKGFNVQWYGPLTSRLGSQSVVKLECIQTAAASLYRQCLLDVWLQEHPHSYRDIRRTTPTAPAAHWLLRYWIIFPEWLYVVYS